MYVCGIVCSMYAHRCMTRENACFETECCKRKGRLQFVCCTGLCNTTSVIETLPKSLRLPKPQCNTVPFRARETPDPPTKAYIKQRALNVSHSFFLPTLSHSSFYLFILLFWEEMDIQECREAFLNKTLSVSFQFSLVSSVAQNDHSSRF